MFSLSALSFFLSFFFFEFPHSVDVVRPALYSLDEDQQLEGCELIVSYLETVNILIQDQGFIEKIMKVTFSSCYYSN
jgi:hypothetical protein